jgi:ATP-dependent Lon protease
MDAMSSIDIDSMTQNEKLKLIQIGLTYVVPRLKHTEEIKEEPRQFQIEIIDRLTKI